MASSNDFFDKIFDRPIAKGSAAPPKITPARKPQAQPFQSLKPTFREGLGSYAGDPKKGVNLALRDGKARYSSDTNASGGSMRTSDTPQRPSNKKRPLDESEKKSIELLRAYNRGEKLSTNEVLRVVNVLESAGKSCEPASGANSEFRIQHDAKANLSRFPERNPKAFPSSGAMPRNTSHPQQSTKVLPKRAIDMKGNAGKSGRPTMPINGVHKDKANVKQTFIVPGLTNINNFKKPVIVQPKRSAANHRHPAMKRLGPLVLSGVTQPTPTPKSAKPIVNAPIGDVKSKQNNAPPTGITYQRPQPYGDYGRQSAAQSRAYKDEDDDDDMDDFIDDTPLDGAGWVGELRSITGYNPTAYVDVGEASESSASQLVFEERRSTLIAKEEDAREYEMIHAEALAEAKAKKRRAWR